MSRKRQRDEDASTENKDDGVFVYYEHTDLKSIPKGITSLRIDKSVKTIPPKAFYGQKELTNIVYEEGLEVIGGQAFQYCTNLRKQQFPSTLIEIGRWAFFFCTKLAKIELPPGLKTIGYDAFHKTGLKHFHCPANVESIGTLAECKGLESVVLPPKLEIIPDSMFSGCTKLKGANAISIPQSLVHIGHDAFARCEGLTQLDLSRLKLKHIREAAFSGCFNLETIMLPRQGLKLIEEKCFQDCVSLTHLWIPPTVENIENGAFAGCRSLVSVEVPESLESLVFVGYDYETGVIADYESLVNIFIPPSHQLDDVSEVDRDHRFMQWMKLEEAESSYPELVRKLKRRFDSLPLHRACYFQSYYSLQDNIQSIQSIAQSDIDGPARACERTDFLGMTPFHILALSHRPWLNLFQALISLSSSSVDIILYCRDVFGCTPLDYLCKNQSLSAIGVTKSLLVHILEPRISSLGLVSWRDDIQSDLDNVHLVAEGETLSLATKVSSLCQKLAMLERMEVLSLLEMAVWKMKIKDENAAGNDYALESCRINCGSSTVLEHVMPLLKKG